MSDGEYRDETRIAHMLEALSRLSAEVLEIKDVGDLSLADRLTRAVMCDFIILGEAANNLSESFCSAHPDIPWRDIAGFRHKLVHDYSGIDFGVVFDALKRDVPLLLPKIRKLADTLPQPPALPSNITDFE